MAVLGSNLFGVRMAFLIAVVAAATAISIKIAAAEETADQMNARLQNVLSQRVCTSGMREYTRVDLNCGNEYFNQNTQQCLATQNDLNATIIDYNSFVRSCRHHY